MYLIENLSNNPKQITTWQNGDMEVKLYFEYRPNQLGWFIGVKYQDVVDYKNIRLTVHRNLLRSYLNVLPFGIMCLTEDGLEPMGIEDLTNGYTEIYMLTRDECKQIEEEYYA